MQIKSLKILRAYDRDTGAALFVNGEVVTTVNYDEHGSDGERVLVAVAEGLSKLSGLRVEEDEVPDEEFRAAT